MKPSLIILLLTAVLVLSGCKSEEEKIETKPKQGETYVLPPQQEQPQQTIQKQVNIDPKIAAEIISVIRENIAATQAKDKERVLKTIHKDCPQLRSTIQGMDYVFANFDMIFDLEKIEVIELSGEDAKVYYMQTTRAIRGQGYPPTRSTGIHIMKKENGKWKIFKTEYLSNEQIM
jgi:type IV secretory pathway VirJ component